MSGVRVRRHTDGRYAVSLRDEADAWIVMSHWAPTVGVSDAVVSGEGWVELLVAQLPEPDGWAAAVGDNGEDARTPYWETGHGTYTVWNEGVEDDNGLNEGTDLELLRIDALKMLAACEQHRQKVNRK